METVEHDIRGQICPGTLLFTLREVNNHADEIGDGKLKLIIKTDNRDATTTIPESVANMGFGVTVTKGDGYYTIEIGGETA